MPVPVIQAVHEHYLKEITLGGYEAADRERQWLGDIYGYLAKLIRQSLQISRLWKMLPGPGHRILLSSLAPRDIILTSTTEYAGNYIPYLQRQNVMAFRSTFWKRMRMGLFV